MNATWILPTSWLVRSTIAGSLLLLAVWALVAWTRQPARRQRLAEWGVLAALLAALLSWGPTRLPLPLDLLPSGSNLFLLSQHQSTPPATFAEPDSTLDDSQPGGGEDGFGWPAEISQLHSPDWPETDYTIPGSESGAAAPPVLTPKSDTVLNFPWTLPLPNLSVDHLALASLATYGLGVLLFTGRWLVGWLALQRFLRHCRPAPAPAAELFAEMTRHRKRPPRLLTSARLRLPVSCGVRRPTVVLPAHFAEPAHYSRLRWVFTHELTHLERRDPWSCLLFGLAQGVFFYCPWFWWLRRQVRLCQEFIADAAAARQAGPADEYAQFLVSLAEAPAGPRVAIGVLGHRSDLFRRVTMLLQNRLRIENRCPPWWSPALILGLFTAAVLASGIGLRAADADPEPREQKAQSPDKKGHEVKQEHKIIKNLIVEENGSGVTVVHIDPEDDLDLEALRKALDKLPSEGEIERLKKDLLKKVQDLKANPALKKAAGLRVWNVHTGAAASGTRLGAMLAKPSPALVEQLDLPRDKGLVINHVFPDHPAAKAGLKENDILLELDGKAVPSDPAAFVRLLQEIKSDTPVDAVVIRKGKKETVKGIKLTERKAELRNARPAIQAVPPAGAGGLRPVPVTPALPPVPAAPRLPGAPPNVMFNGAAPANTVMTSIFRTDDRFTGRHQEGSLIITVTGNVSDGKAKVKEIHVQDGKTAEKFESADKVPERYKDKVKNLIEMSEKGSVKVETHRLRS